MKKLSVIFILFSLPAAAQFDPPAGQTASLSVYKDSSAVKAWATGCEVQRGYQDISNTSLGLATSGTVQMVLGASNSGVLSLGDGGSAVLTFATAIVNGDGADFAVFENSFSDDYLELAFVEVSSDGINYFRFPASSNTQTAVQVGGFGTLDATKLHNLAGKYRAQYGTPFDLEELKDEVNLDVNNILYVKVIDAVGSINSSFATYDSRDSMVNDPWPTPFPSSGFDLEAVAVLHAAPAAVLENESALFSMYPNPSSAVLNVQCVNNDFHEVLITDADGRNFAEYSGNGSFTLDVSMYPAGLYFLQFKSINTVGVGKFSKI